MTDSGCMPAILQGCSLVLLHCGIPVLITGINNILKVERGYLLCGKQKQSRELPPAGKAEKTEKRRGNGNAVSSAKSPGSGTFKSDSHADFPLYISLDRLGVYRWTWQLEFVGFQNFIDLWKDSWFQKSLWNTVIFTIVTVPLTIILALVIGKD